MANPPTNRLITFIRKLSRKAPPGLNHFLFVVSNMKASVMVAKITPISTDKVRFRNIGSRNQITGMVIIFARITKNRIFRVFFARSK